MKNKGVWVSRTRKLVIIAILAVFIALPLFSVRANLREDLKETRTQKESIKEKKEETEKEAQSLAARVANMDEQIKQVSKEIKKTKKEIKQTKKDIISTQEQIEENEKELIKQEEILEEGLRYIYEEQDQSVFLKLFAYDTFNQVLDNAQYLEAAESKIQDTIEEINNLKNGLEEEKSDLLTKRESLKELRLQLKVSKKSIKKEQKEKEKLLKKTKGKEDQYQLLIEAKRAEERKLLRRIQNLSKNGNGKHYDGDEYKEEKENKDDKQNKKEDKKNKKKQKQEAKFVWPLRNFHLTQNYGMTKYAKSGAYNGASHNGIDLSSVANKNGFTDLRVRSVMKGEVIMVTHESISGGWGNAVAIAHPNGMFTLYGHMSRVLVKEGQKVNQGQMIGIEGSTGNSTGRHLHFSVYMSITIYKTNWYYGPGYDFQYTLNPLNFLPKLK